jgi:hypothetical protein
VLNPADWARHRADQDSYGEYIFANPMQLAGPRLWGKPVVSTPVAMTIDKFLVGGSSSRRSTIAWRPRW